jgi:hypothetical protein
LRQNRQLYRHSLLNPLSERDGQKRKDVRDDRREGHRTCGMVDRKSVPSASYGRRSCRRLRDHPGPGRSSVFHRSGRSLRHLRGKRRACGGQSRRSGRPHRPGGAGHRSLECGGRRRMVFLAYPRSYGGVGGCRASLRRDEG